MRSRNPHFILDTASQFRKEILGNVTDASDRHRVQSDDCQPYPPVIEHERLGKEPIPDPPTGFLRRNIRAPDAREKDTFIRPNRIRFRAKISSEHLSNGTLERRKNTP